VPVGDGGLGGEQLVSAFHDRHRRRYTFALEGTPVEVVNLRVVVTARISRPRIGTRDGATSGAAEKGSRAVRFTMDGALADRIMTPVYARERLARHSSIAGPAIVEEPSTTTVVQPGQQLTVDKAGNLIISAAESSR
jgi:N-methylhydantoinase A